MCVLNADPPSWDRRHRIYVFDVSEIDVPSVIEMSLPQFWCLTHWWPPGRTIWRVIGVVLISVSVMNYELTFKDWVGNSIIRLFFQAENCLTYLSWHHDALSKEENLTQLRVSLICISPGNIPQNEAEDFAFSRGPLVAIINNTWVAFFGV